MSSRIGLACLAVGVALVVATGVVAVAIDPPLGGRTAEFDARAVTGLLLWLTSGAAGFVIGLIALVLSRPHPTRTTKTSSYSLASPRVDAAAR